MRRSYGLSLVILGACSGGDGEHSIEVVHDACAPPRVVAPVTTEAQALGLAQSESLWRERGAPALGSTDDAQAEEVLEVRFETAAGAFFGYYDGDAGIIYINDRITDPTLLSIVVAHEIGHAFGLVHVEHADRLSLMNPGNTATPPTEDDQREIERLWGVCD